VRNINDYAQHYIYGVFFLDAIRSQIRVISTSQHGEGAEDDLSLRKVLAIFLRTWPYIRPSSNHLIIFVVLSGFTFLVGVGMGILLIYLATNGIMSAEPMSEFYVTLYGLDPARYHDVEVLSAQARKDLAIPTVLTAVFGALFAITVLSLLTYYSVWIFQAINQRLRIHLVDQLLAQSLAYHANAQTGDAIYRVYQDSAMVTGIIRSIFIEPLMYIGRYLTGIVIVAAFSPSLALILLFTVLPIAWLGRKFSGPLRIKFRIARENNAALTSWIQESVQGIRVIKATHNEAARTREFEGRSKSAFAAAFQSRVSVNVLGILAFATVGIAMIAVQSIAAIYSHEAAETFARDLLLTFGFAIWNFAAFSTATSRTTDGFVSIRAIAALWGKAQDMAIGLRRVFDILDLEPDVKNAPDAVDMPRFAKEVRFTNVDFSYVEGQQVLTQVNFSATRGSITAIVGATGVGKSTLMSLLLRLIDPAAGSVSVDGTDIRKFSLESLRHQISIATQENILFSDTVLNNILFAAPDASRDAAIAAAKITCAHEFIVELPHGYDTPLGERAIKLSSGQRQRLVLARAIVRDTPILILDEPTAALDAETEHRVLANIKAWSTQRCVFLITHRLSTIRQATNVLYLRDGQIVAQGKHDLLLEDGNTHYKNFIKAETGTG